MKKTRGCLLVMSTIFIFNVDYLLAQNAKPNQFDPIMFRAGSLLLSEPLTSSSGNYVPIYRTSENSKSLFYFIPPVIIDYDYISSEITKICSNGRSDNVRMQAPVSFYNDDLISEMKSHILRNSYITDKNQPISVTPPPAAGILIFALDENAKPLKIFSNVPETSLLLGYETSPVNGGLSRTGTSSLFGSCEQLISIARARHAMGFLIAGSVSVKINSLRAAANIMSNTSFRSDLDNAESGVDKQTISGSKKSSGFSIKAGGFSLGGSSTTPQTTTESIRYRIINRSWLESRVSHKANSLIVEQQCDTETCGDAALTTAIINQVFDGFKEEQIDIRKKDDMYWAHTSSKGALPIGKIKISTEVKAVLDASLNANTENEFEYGVIKGKNKEGIVTTDNSDISWKKDGEDWVPVTMKAHVYDTTEVNRRIDASYNQTIYGSSSLVAASMQQLSPRKAHTDDSIKLATIKNWLDNYYRNVWSRRNFQGLPPMQNSNVGKNSAERSPNSVYINQKDFPIEIEIQIGLNENNYCSAVLKLDGLTVQAKTTRGVMFGPGFTEDCNVSTEVPPGSTYELQMAVDGGKISMWAESSGPPT